MIRSVSMRAALLAIALACAVNGVMAQTPIDELSVSPGTPAAGDRVSISVPALACFNSQPVPIVESANAIVRGTTIDIEVVQPGWTCFSAGDPPVDKPLSVDVGTLPAGSYCVNYTRRMHSVNMVRQLAFAVGIPFTAEAACSNLIAAHGEGRTLSAISTASSAARLRIPLPDGMSPTLHGEVGPNGDVAYITASGGPLSGASPPGRALLVVDLHSATVRQQIELPDYAEVLAVSPDGQRAFVTAIGGLAVVSIPEGRVVQQGLSIGGRMLFSPGGKYLYTLGTDLRIYDAETLNLLGTYSVSGTRFALSPDGTALFVATRINSQAGIVRFSTIDKRVEWSVTIPTTAEASVLTTDPDGDKIYVVYPAEHALAEVDARAGAYRGAFYIEKAGDGALNWPEGISVSSDGKRLFIQGNVAGTPRTNVMSTESHEIVATIPGHGQMFGNNLLGPRRLSLPVAVEYFHSEFGHYFMTSNAAEIEKLDHGVFTGWKRTGQSFKVFPVREPSTFPVIRFFSSSFAPKSSHFYTLRTMGFDVTPPPVWQYEGEPFYMASPGVSGICPENTVPIYRYFNRGQGGAPNHRFVADPSVRAAMLAAGWIPEGYGVGVAMCGPV